MINKVKKIIRCLFLIIILFVLFFFSINCYIINFWDKFIYKQAILPNNRIWLVLWAWINNNSHPTDILKDRLDTAIEVYKNKTISKIIVSWDNSTINHNEPLVMEKYLILNWVSKEDIFKDHAWFDTYDSIYRAKVIFQVEKMIIFTQKYHLYRALYISNKLWIDSYWIATDKHTYLDIRKFKSREMLSRIKAFFEIEILDSKPKFFWDKLKIN